MKFRNEGREIVYLDHTHEGVWTENKKGILSSLEPPCKECGRQLPSYIKSLNITNMHQV